MGKNPNRKMKWKKLQMEPEPSIIDNNITQKPNPEVHPFLKIISKNMDVIVKRDSVKAQSDRNLVYMYRSDKSVGVSDPLDLNQYAGVPIQYTEQYTTVQYNPAEFDQAVHNSTSHYSTEHQQYSPSTQPNTTPTLYNVPQTYYYGPSGQHQAHQYTQQTQFIPHVLPNNYPHLPQQQPPSHVISQDPHNMLHVPPQDHPHTPHVEYIPLYYYYPVPVPTYTQEVPTTPPNCTSSSNESQPKLAQQNSTGSTTSCDSCFVQDKVIRRRRKKKKSIEIEYQEFDSGYFNGAESSSELNSDKEQNMAEKVDTELNERGKDENGNLDNNHNEENEREITNLLIKQVQNPTIDFQFGDVQEILDELKSAKILEIYEEIINNADVNAENEKSYIQHLKKQDCPLDIETNKVVEKMPNLNLQSDESINKESEYFKKEITRDIQDNISESTIIEKEECTSQDTLYYDQVLGESNISFQKDENDFSTKFLNSKMKNTEKPLPSIDKSENVTNKEVETISNEKYKIINIEHLESSNKEKSEKVKNKISQITSNKKNKNDKKQKIKNPQSEDLILVASKPITNSVLESDNNNEKKKEIQIEQIESWTKVKKSRKNKYNMNKHFEEKCVEFGADTIITIEEVNKKDLHQKDVKNDFIEEVKETCTLPLEKRKTLFFEEKSVEIINKSETTRKKLSKKERKQNKSKNKPKAQKLSTTEDEGGISSDNVENLTTPLNELNFPVLFFHPFLNVEDQLSGDHLGQIEHTPNEISQQSQINTNHEGTLSKNSKDEPEPYKLTFLELGFSPQVISDLSYSQKIISDPVNNPQKISDYNHKMLCGTSFKQQENLEEDYFLYSCVEEHLVEMNFLTRNNKKVPNKVILIRRKNVPTKMPPTHKGKTPVKKTEVPGPRLKYNPVVRAGPLGVKRQVVPPQCLVRRFARI